MYISRFNMSEGDCNIRWRFGFFPVRLRNAKLCMYLDLNDFHAPRHFQLAYTPQTVQGPDKDHHNKTKTAQDRPKTASRPLRPPKTCPRPLHELSKPLKTSPRPSLEHPKTDQDPSKTPLDSVGFPHNRPTPPDQPDWSDLPASATSTSA